MAGPRSTFASSGSNVIRDPCPNPGLLPLNFKGISLLYLLLLLFILMTSETEAQTASILSRSAVGKYPLLEVHAQSPWSLGYVVGKEFAPRIRSFLAAYGTLHKKLIPFVETPSGRAAFDTLWAAQNRTYPYYVEEVEGIAAGAGVDPLHCALMSMKAELLVLINTQADLLETHCTDLHVGGTVMGHNEDGSVHASNTSFFLHAHTEYPRSSPSEWVAFVYPGQTAGAAFGVNCGTGVGASLNAVFPKDVSLQTVGRYIVGRALLDADSIETALIMIQRFGVASGESYNVGRVGDVTTYNVEIRGSAPNVSVLATSASQYQWHFNMYSRLQVPQFPEASSEHRLARANAMPVPSTPSDVLRELGDHGDAMYPIYRDGTPPDSGVATLATGLFRFDLGELHVYDSDPATSQPVWTIHFGTTKGGLPAWAVGLLCGLGAVVVVSLVTLGVRRLVGRQRQRKMESRALLTSVNV